MEQHCVTGKGKVRMQRGMDPLDTKYTQATVKHLVLCCGVRLSITVGKLVFEKNISEQRIKESL